MFENIPMYPNETHFNFLCRNRIVKGGWVPYTFSKMYFSETPSFYLPTCPKPEYADELFPNEKYDILNEHSLYPYISLSFVRQDISNTQNLYGKDLKKLLLYTKHKLTFEKMDTFPKVCPLCVNEQYKQYGEPFWEWDKQIPIVQTCPKHKTKLLSLNVSITKLCQQMQSAREICEDLELEVLKADYLQLEFDNFVYRKIMNNQLGANLREEIYKNLIETFALYPEGLFSLYEEISDFYMRRKMKSEFDMTESPFLFSRTKSNNYFKLLIDSFVSNPKELLQTAFFFEKNHWF